ncbi:MAG: helix-turn-helix domain-containing protein [Lachnospiraceae bacterium]|nr:helix-turn-helix domain-containing protein [Lachnospiraceae bacterium]
MRITGQENNRMILEELGSRIRDLRIAMSLTQKDMASKAGISLRTVERMESGENVGVECILNVMRVCMLLPSLEVLIPMTEITPVMRLRQEKKRKRVTARAKEQTSREWKWGDET